MDVENGRAMTDNGIFDGAKNSEEVLLADSSVFRTPEEPAQTRWRSPALWAALLGLLGTIGFSTGLFAKIGLTGEVWTALGTFVSAVLAAFGIANNPTDRENF